MVVLVDVKNYFIFVHLKTVGDTFIPKEITVIPHSWKPKIKLPIHSALNAFQQLYHEDSSCKSQ